MTRRYQRTVWVDGCRVLIRWSDTGRGRVKVTDPAGDYAKEQHVLAYTAGIAAHLFASRGMGLNIGAPRVIRDHEAEA